MLCLATARHACDCHRQSHGVWLAGNLDVLDVATMGAGHRGRLVGGFLDLPIVVSDLLRSVPEVLLFGLLDEAVDEEVIGLEEESLDISKRDVLTGRVRVRKVRPGREG